MGFGWAVALLFGLALKPGGSLAGRELARLHLDGLVLVDDGQQPVFQVDLLLEVGLPRFMIIQFGAGVADGRRELFSGEEVLVESLHQQFGSADGHRIAHRQHKLHASLHQAAAQTGFRFAYLFA